MTPSLGIGVALVVVAASTLIPAVLTGSIPTTTSRQIRRHERPTEFWATFTVMAVAATVGAGMILVSLFT